MKNTFVLFAILLLAFSARAQDKAVSTQPNIALKWAPAGLYLGNVSLQAEYNFGGNNSLTAKIGLPAMAHHAFTFDQKDAAFTMRATSFLAGYRTYFSMKHLKGFYYEPFFTYVHHTSEGSGTGNLNSRTAQFSFTNDYNGAGVGLQLGVQFLIGRRIVIDLFFLGPEINSASNSFKAMEVSNTVPWNEIDARDAEKQIRSFIDQFPFLRNRTDILVDKENKRVLADFKGALPGLRTGVSVGIAF